jgi:hypothetical protein
VEDSAEGRVGPIVTAVRSWPVSRRFMNWLRKKVVEFAKRNPEKPNHNFSIELRIPILGKG